MSIPIEELIEAVGSCFYALEELEVGDNGRPIGVKSGIAQPVVVEGIISTMYFHPDRLEKIREQILGYLKQFPEDFHEEAGGLSFLALCELENGELWTGEHRNMESLMCVGIALGYIVYSVEGREFWKALPGGMPYIQFRSPLEVTNPTVIAAMEAAERGEVKEFEFPEPKKEKKTYKTHTPHCTGCGHNYFDRPKTTKSKAASDLCKRCIASCVWCCEIGKMCKSCIEILRVTKGLQKRQAYEKEKKDE